MSDNVLIRRNAIAIHDLRILNEYVNKAGKVDSLVSNFEDDAPDETVEWVVNKRIRDTQEVALTNPIRAQLDSLLAAHIKEHVNLFYGVEVRDWEPVQILHYGVGGHYIPHVDSETLYTDDRDRKFWEKTLDRDISVVYFLNDDFVGGELVFPELNLVIKPQAGMLVCFPSDHHYIHGVNAVTNGHRYTAVTWMRVKDMLTMDEINGINMDEYQRCWPNEFAQPSRIAKKS